MKSKIAVTGLTQLGIKPLSAALAAGTLTRRLSELMKLCKCKIRQTLCSKAKEYVMKKKTKIMALLCSLLIDLALQTMFVETTF